MDFKDVTKNLANQTSYRLEQRFNRMMRLNPRYKNLDRDNRRLVLDILEKYKDKARSGVKPSRLTIKADTYRLYKDRLKLNLSTNDLKQIRELPYSFKD